jgi:hypothetical protein
LEPYPSSRDLIAPKPRVARIATTLLESSLMGNPGTLRRKTFPGKVRGTTDPSAAPDFLLSPMGSAKRMRLSLMKAANEVIFGAA